MSDTWKDLEDTRSLIKDGLVLTDIEGKALPKKKVQENLDRILGVLNRAQWELDGASALRYPAHLTVDRNANGDDARVVVGTVVHIHEELPGLLEWLNGLDD